MIKVLIPEQLPHQLILQKNNNLKYEEIGRGAIWSDAGKIEDLTNLSNFVHSVEKVQNINFLIVI